jgi:Tfp pilus assembly protein PilV
LVAAGDANKMVAKKLSIALGTVKVHVRSIMSKLGARTRTEAAAVAQRRGLVELHAEAIAMPSQAVPWTRGGPPDASIHRQAHSTLRIASQR